MSYSANPRHPNNPPSSIPNEPTGPIAADSLGAESLKAGGDFAANNPDATPLGVSGSNSTLNTTDNSNATALPPAADGTEREKLNAKGLGSDEKGVSGVKYPDGAGEANFDGKHTASGEYYGGPSGNKSSSGDAPAGASDFGANTTTSSSSAGQSGNTSSSGTSNTTSSSRQTTTGPSTAASSASTAAGVRPHVDAAPNYAARVSGAISNPNEQQPKGTNLTEGGDVPEGKKTFVGAVTGPNDPGRFGEQNFEKINAQAAGGGVAGGKEGETEVGGQYGVLEGKKL